MARYSVYGPWAGDSWNAFDELRRDMDALLGRRSATPPGSARGVYPAANLYETGDAYVLTAELPGVASGDIHVALEGSTVTLRGERRIGGSQEGASVHRRERQAGSFQRAFELPLAVDADKVEAVHRNGVLMLRLPKAPEHRPRRISIQTS